MVARVHRSWCLLISVVDEQVLVDGRCGPAKHVERGVLLLELAEHVAGGHLDCAACVCEDVGPREEPRAGAPPKPVQLSELQSCHFTVMSLV